MSSGVTSNIKVVILTIVFSIAVIGVGVYFALRTYQSNLPVDKVLQDYDELEQAYTKAVQELEEVSNNDYGNIDILKQNLQEVLRDIKEKKKNLDETRRSAGLRFDIDTSLAQNYRDKLEMSKQVADAILLQRLAEVEAQNKELVDQNEDLVEQFEELETELVEMKDFHEKEKTKNVKLQETMKVINEKITTMETKDQINSQELNQLKQVKAEFEQKLDLSNRMIEQQKSQMNEYIGDLRKASLDCYFIYEKDNKAEEAKIFLTSTALAARYFKYFQKVKPDVMFGFSVNKQIFLKGSEKVTFIIFDDKNNEVYTVEKVVSGNSLTITVPGKYFKQGIFTAVLRQGNEELLIDGEYEFVIDGN